MPRAPATELSGPDFVRQVNDNYVLVQPVGSIEHHGPHLPLATDSIVVDALAKAVLADHPELRAGLLPTLSYGLSSEHIWAGGTVSLSVPTLLGVLDDVAASAARSHVERLAILNGHGGNTHLFRAACREVRAKYGLKVFLLHGSLPPDNGGPVSDRAEEGLGIHGGLGETSVMLYLRPDLVDMGKAERSVPSWVNQYRYLGFSGPGEFAWLSNDLSASGVSGDPTLASAELGKHRFEAAVASVAAQLEEASRFAFPHENPATGC